MIDYFNNLAHSIATARLLLQKAHKNGAAIEGLCLYVSTIDAFLRLALIYSRTQKAPNHSHDVEKRMLHQEDGEKTFSEQQIYRLALEEKIISLELHARLVAMYQFRNKVVHRFNISTVVYSEIQDACVTFEAIYHEVFEILNVLENGPHGIRKMSQEERREVNEAIMKKVGSGGLL